MKEINIEELLKEKGLKSFTIVEISTGKQFGSDCTFYQDGVLCFDTYDDGTCYTYFIKHGEYEINEITYEVQNYNYLDDVNRYKVKSNS